MKIAYIISIILFCLAVVVTGVIFYRKNKRLDAKIKKLKDDKAKYEIW